MTHDILRSDIELATRLIADQRTDEEIITALSYRRVDPAKAAHLLDDLRNGREVSTHSVLPSEFGLARRSRTRNVSQGASQAHPPRSAKADARREPKRHTAVHGHSKSAVSWFVPALVVVLVLVAGGGLMFQRYRAGADSTEQPAPNAPRPKANGTPGQAPAPAAAPTASLVLELQPDGLHIGGSRVTPANVLAAVASALGAATRTNRVGQSDTVIYAYDQQGLLIYTHPDGGTNSIILDCEANGGIHGTTSPFKGAVTVEGQVIRPDTDPKMLTAIKPLALNHPGSHSDIWGGRYNDLQLVFAYLKSSQRLSLIEIDLK